MSACDCCQLNDEGKVADCMTTKGVAYGTACSEQFKVCGGFHLTVFIGSFKQNFSDGVLKTTPLKLRPYGTLQNMLIILLLLFPVRGKT